MNSRHSSLETAVELAANGTERWAVDKALKTNYNKCNEKLKVNILLKSYCSFEYCKMLFLQQKKHITPI